MALGIPVLGKADLLEVGQREVIEGGQELPQAAAACEGLERLRIHLHAPTLSPRRSGSHTRIAAKSGEAVEQGVPERWGPALPNRGRQAKMLVCGSPWWWGLYRGEPRNARGLILAGSRPEKRRPGAAEAMAQGSAPPRHPL